MRRTGAPASPSPTSPTAETGAGGAKEQGGALAEKAKLARRNTQAELLRRANRTNGTTRDLLENFEVSKDAVRVTAPHSRGALPPKSPL